ncbi:hypothetical protein BU23DRAFT_595946 [Bimuria novae-zelandiae CBS 107.79]|uniref:Uncharacterized protein n=1 Tax=Bimuria novae-zelandiae CBS 107.79 TaxID=1447943 RepID=A0A6A5VTH9_9PLEO|nr:hypothetical protein BU23DRAFT_595946 [Bimuria novae-zelandiae CBS 107.79]
MAKELEKHRNGTRATPTSGIVEMKHSIRESKGTTNLVASYTLSQGKWYILGALPTLKDPLSSLTTLDESERLSPDTLHSHTYALEACRKLGSHTTQRRHIYLSTTPLTLARFFVRPLGSVFIATQIGDLVDIAYSALTTQLAPCERREFIPKYKEAGVSWHELVESSPDDTRGNDLQTYRYLQYSFRALSFLITDVTDAWLPNTTTQDTEAKQVFLGGSDVRMNDIQVMHGGQIPDLDKTAQIQVQRGYKAFGTRQKMEQWRRWFSRTNWT